LIRVESVVMVLNRSFLAGLIDGEKVGSVDLEGIEVWQHAF